MKRRKWKKETNKKHTNTHAQYTRLKYRPKTTLRQILLIASLIDARFQFCREVHQSDTTLTRTTSIHPVHAISQLPKLCVKISILMHRRMWVRSFSTRLTSVTFAEDNVLIFLILRKNAKIVQL